MCESRPGSQLRDFRSLRSGGRAAGAGADGRLRPQRRRQDEPARGALLRLHGPLVPDGQRARGGALRRRADAAGAARARTRWAGTRSAVGFKPGEPKRLRADGAPVENLTGVEARPLVVGLPARPAGARAGRAGAAARRTSTRSSPRCGRPGPARAAPTPPRSRSATRCWPRSAPAARRAPRCRPGTPSWPATASR